MINPFIVLKADASVGRYCLWLMLLCLPSLALATPVPRNTLVPAGLSRYQATAFPDRIVLTPTANPATSQSVSWRTGHGVPQALAQITPAGDSPGLHLAARQVTGTTTPLRTDNGLAHHHQVTFDGLQPDSLYAYRVLGQGTWSEWLQFRTPSEAFRPLQILYFGDAQNSIQSHFSRVARAALLSAPQAALMLHAGDLVSSRRGILDDEWGEWFDASGWQARMINQVAAAGNHEYITLHPDTADERKELVPQFAAQFHYPGNGPEGLRDTVYYVDYQGVRIVVLDSTLALEDPAYAEAQTRWLEQVLQHNTARWTLALYHHPMYSVSEGRDNALLRQYWQPLFRRYGVDLALQGHDHTYGRTSVNLPVGANRFSEDTVYVVSVAGPKMYLSSAQAAQQMVHLGEDTQLYQVLDIEQDRLRYRALTPTGQVYDSFELVRTADGGKQLRQTAPLPERRFCGNPMDQRQRPDRCWNGDELVETP